MTQNLLGARPSRIGRTRFRSHYFVPFNDDDDPMGGPLLRQRSDDFRQSVVPIGIIEQVRLNNRHGQEVQHYARADYPADAATHHRSGGSTRRRT